MSVCPNCGGILGQECFDVVECGQITMAMAGEAQNWKYDSELQQARARELQQADRIAELEQALRVAEAALMRYREEAAPMDRLTEQYGLVAGAHRTLRAALKPAEPPAGEQDATAAAEQSLEENQ